MHFKVLQELMINGADNDALVKVLDRYEGPMLLIDGEPAMIRAMRFAFNVSTNRYVHIIKQLLSKGCTLSDVIPNTNDNCFSTLLSLCSKTKLQPPAIQNVIEVLTMMKMQNAAMHYSKDGCNFLWLLICCDDNDLVLLEWILKNVPVDVNHRNAMGQLPIFLLPHYSNSSIRSQVTKLLCEYGMRPTKQDIADCEEYYYNSSSIVSVLRTYLDKT